MIATGAVIAWTSSPPSPGPVISAIASVASIFEFPSMRFSLPIRGREIRSLGDLEERRRAARERRHDVELAHAQTAQPGGKRNGQKQDGTNQIGADQ